MCRQQMPPYLGSSITSAWTGGGIGILSGTSSAVPPVASYVGCILTVDSYMTPSAVVFAVRFYAVCGVPNGIRKSIYPQISISLT